MPLSCAILGATGQVGKQFFHLLKHHPWFEVKVLAASARSKGKKLHDMTILSVEDDIEEICDQVDFVFSAISADKETTKSIEEMYARSVPVVSNNSAHRWTSDVPMIIPEINACHTDMIDIQRSKRGWEGFIAVKPNCSIQSYMPPLSALQEFGLSQVIVSTYQAISGAGKDFDTWPEMRENVIPYIAGEEEKSEREPLKIWSTIQDGVFQLANNPIISANCIRVPVLDGHMASIHVSLDQKISKDQVLQKWQDFQNTIQCTTLPSSPQKFLTYFEEEDRPQTTLDRDLYDGMGVSVGRLRRDSILDFTFVCLSHNTIRGAAGGAILLAELLKDKGFLSIKH